MEVEVVVGEVREHGDGEASAAHAAEGEGVRRHLHRHGLAARRDLSREEGLELGRLRGGARTAEGADDRGGPAVVLEHGGQQVRGGRLAAGDRKSTRLNSSHYCASRMPSSAWKKKHEQTISQALDR